MIAWFAPARALPSTDLYFRHACRAAIASPWHRAPIRAQSANCFTSGDAMLLVRNDIEETMRAALDWHGRLAYVIDDDIAGAAASPGLLDGYRRRLAQFDATWHQKLIARADLLLAASDALAAQLADRWAQPVQRVDPFWALPLADQRHFTPPGRSAPFHIAHLGSGSHLPGLRAIAPTMAALLESHSSVHFTYIAAQPVSVALEAHPRARRLPPRRWPRYRRWLAATRFHLALYPLTATPFDAARSANKLWEHAIVGAVGIYPHDWRAAGLVGNGAILAPADPQGWRATLEQAVARRDDLAGKAAEAAQALTRLDPASAQRRLWSDFFGVAM